MGDVSEHGAVKEFLRDEADIEGRTVLSVREERVGWVDYLIIRFTDGTALALRETTEDDGWSREPVVFQEEYDRSELVYFGLYDKAKFDREESEKKLFRERAEAQKQYAEYQRLKARFEGGST